MPPKIALCFCIVFISAIFIRELRQESNVSHALLIPLIWMIFSSSKNLSRWLNPGPIIATEIDYTIGSPIDRTFLAILIFCGLFVLYRRKEDWSKILKSNGWIIVFFVYLGLSILWSDFMGVSFKRWIKNIGSFIMILVVLTEPDPVEAVKKMIRRCAYVLIPLSVLFIKYYRNMGVAYDYSGATMWIGVTTHKNELGQLSCLSSLFFLWNIITLYREKKAFNDKMELLISIFLLLMSLWLLNGSKTSASMTSIFAFIVGICIFIALSTMKKKSEHIGKYIFFIVVVIIPIFLLAFEFLFPIFVSSAGRDATLTGRTDLWKELIEIGSRHPIIGTGYGSFWIGDIGNDLWAMFSWRPESAHNGYIDIYVELGLMGLFFLIQFIYFAYKSILRELLFDFEYGRLQMTFLFMILVANITESSFAKPTGLFWFIFLLIAVDIPRVALYQDNKRIK